SKSSTPTSQSTGRLFMASDVSRLFAYFSAGTYLVGTAFSSENASDASTGYWARETGTLSSSVQANTQHVVFGLPFLATPTIIQSISSAAASGVSMLIGVSTTAGVPDIDKSG